MNWYNNVSSLMMKPVDIDELKEALDRYRDSLEANKITTPAMFIKNTP